MKIQNKIEEIINLYNSGLSQSKISKIMNVSQSAISKILTKNKIDTKNKHHREHYLNESFFEEWSSDMAYILGFITADGSVDKYTLSIKISNKDIEIIYFIRSKIGNVNMEQCKNNSVRIRFNSKKIISSLSKYNIVSNKTNRLNINFNIPEQYVPDYVRGFFDGDGWVYSHPTGGISFGMTSISEIFIQQIYNLIGKIGKIRCRDYQNDPIRVPQFYIEGYKKYAIPFAKFIYTSNNFALSRKKSKFLKFI